MPTTPLQFAEARGFSDQRTEGDVWVTPIQDKEQEGQVAFLSVYPADLAKRLGVSERFLRRKAREFGTCRILGRTMIFLQEDVNDLVAHLSGANVKIDAEIRKEIAKERAQLGRPSHPPRGGFVYYISSGDGRVKIGHAHNLQRRLMALQVSHPSPLLLLAYQRGSRKTERELHKQFSAHRLRGEWFSLADEIKQHIENLGHR